MKKDEFDSLKSLSYCGLAGLDNLLPTEKLAKEPLDADAAYRLVLDELLDEGVARQNLATFCQTYMEPEAVQLM